MLFQFQSSEAVDASLAGMMGNDSVMFDHFHMIPPDPVDFLSLATSSGTDDSAVDSDSPRLIADMADSPPPEPLPLQRRRTNPSRNGTTVKRLQALPLQQLLLLPASAPALQSRASLLKSVLPKKRPPLLPLMSLAKNPNPNRKRSGSDRLRRQDQMGCTNVPGQAAAKPTPRART